MSLTAPHLDPSRRRMLTRGRKFGSVRSMVTRSRRPVRCDLAVMGGIPVFRASHVPAQARLDDGYTLHESPELFPTTVDRGDASEFVRLAIGQDDPVRP